MRFVITLVLLAGFALSALAEVPVVNNGATPANGIKSLQLEEMWRAGGASDDENFFGLVTWAEEGPDGLIYVLDVQLCQVNVYDEAGTLVKTLFHEGEGPGEIRQPRDLVIMPDGSVGAVQEFPGKIIRVDSDNNPLPSIVPHLGQEGDGGLVALTTVDHRGGVILIAGVQIALGERQGQQKRHMFLATVNEQGSVGQPLIESFVDWDFSNFTYDENVNLPSFFWANAVGPDGRIFAAPDRNEYLINVYHPDGSPERTISREYKSRKRTDEDMRWITNFFEGAFRQVPFSVGLKLSDYDSDIHWLNRGVQVDTKGNLWVLPSRGAQDQPDGVLATYDVFTPDGVFDRQVRVTCEGDGDEDGVFLIGEDRILVIKGYVDATATMFGGTPAEEDELAAEADPMEIICYKVLGYTS